MRIIHIQTGMSPAGNAAYRLHCKMREYGLKSSILTYLPTINRNYIYNYNFTFTSILRRKINSLYCKLKYRKLKENTYYFSILPPIANNITSHKSVLNADIIYLHWIAGNFLSAKDIIKLLELGKPTFFFMHDMWTFTGGCHHSFECNEYRMSCQHCPMFKDKQSTTHKQIFIKKRIFEKYDNAYFISPSEWLLKCAKSSNVLSNKQCFQIPNIVDEKIFKPIDKFFARKVLNIPLDSYVITFGCQTGTNNKFKGWDYLRDAINQIKTEKKLTLVIFGSDYNKAIEEELKYPSIFLGPLNDETSIVLVNNASDLFISPSLAESFGLTLLENILCETPVIGFNSTSIPEIIQHKKNGYLASYKSSEEIAQGIYYFLNQNNKLDIVNQYRSNDILKQHLKLIENITKKQISI